MCICICIYIYIYIYTYIPYVHILYERDHSLGTRTKPANPREDILLRAWANDPHESRPHQCEGEGAPRILKPKNASWQVLTTSNPREDS